jgi:hypothetical protein
MFGAACKGLHCLGCGRGIPAGVIAAVAVIVTVLDPGPFFRALAEFLRATWPELLGLSVIAGAALVGTMAVIARMRKAAVLDYSRWDEPTYVQQWEDAAGHPLVGPAWPGRPAIAPPPAVPAAAFLAGTAEPVPYDAGRPEVAG